MERMIVALCTQGLEFFYGDGKKLNNKEQMRGNHSELLFGKLGHC